MGPTASHPQADRLSKKVRSMNVLVGAWHEIRKNAETSRTRSTRDKAREFGIDLPKNLRKIQDWLRNGYHFSKAYGATPSKGKGKSGNRPIVVAPIEDRIVQRAILDVLQDAEDMKALQAVLSTPTSIGGIKGRGVGDAIALYDTLVDEGYSWVAGSDISGFFTKISQMEVIRFISDQTSDDKFVSLFRDALKVELKNEASLPDADRKLFPTGSDGVAQGCPLSALAGNIALQEFDEKFNDASRNIRCIRYIDDFVILAKRKKDVQAAMKNAEIFLKKLGMQIYDAKKSPEKAFEGTASEGHVFLGYKLVPGVYPPSEKACKALIARIEGLLKHGRTQIHKATSKDIGLSHDKFYAQTLVAVNNVINGWSGSFSATKCGKTLKAQDAIIDQRLGDFEQFYRSKVKGIPASRRRRALGVSCVADRIEIKKV